MKKQQKSNHKIEQESCQNSGIEDRHSANCFKTIHYIYIYIQVNHAMELGGISITKYIAQQKRQGRGIENCVITQMKNSRKGRANEGGMGKPLHKYRRYLWMHKATEKRKSVLINHILGNFCLELCSREIIQVATKFSCIKIS